MINLIELLNEDKKIKIYLEPGQKAPKGKKLLKGPKGGNYYMGTPAEKKKAEKKPTKKKVNIFE